MKDQGLARVRRGWQGLGGVFVFLLTLTHPYSPQLTPGFSEVEPTVRVLIQRDVSSVKLGIWGPYELWSEQTGRRLGKGKSLKTQVVRASSGSISIGKNSWETPHMRVVTLQPNRSIRVNGRKYRGEIHLISKEPGKLWVVNRLDIEAYLPGVLGWEVGSLWPMEALKAQAVVSRTMVAHRMWINRDKEYDVTADVSTQVYGGKSSEKWRSREACHLTAGQVLANSGELLSATFHASCGGHTEDARELWNTKGDTTPLAGRPDPYCRKLKHYYWKKRMRRSEFIKLVEARAFTLGSLEQIRLLDRNRSGRVGQVEVVGTRDSLILEGKEFRRRLGANRLRSLNFQAKLSPRGVTFQGLGWGHGVGFCQWGAYGMAHKKKKMDEILSFYFPSTQRRKLQGLPGFS